MLFQSFFCANRPQIANQSVAKRHWTVPQRKITVSAKNRKKRDPKKKREKIRAKQIRRNGEKFMPRNNEELGGTIAQSRDQRRSPQFF
jgi:hypothetical protein